MKRKEYIRAIEKFLEQRGPRPLRARKLARAMGIPDNEYGAFRQAIKALRESGRLAMGARNSLTLPSAENRVTGFFHAHERGFGFVVPKEPNSRKDLYIPANCTGGAMSGDLVVAHVKKKGKRQGKMLHTGEIVSIIQRGQHQCVGTLEQSDETWFVLPDGRKSIKPILLEDQQKVDLSPGTKVLVELVETDEDAQLPVGRITEILGTQGDLKAETLAIIRQHGLTADFSSEALADAESAAQGFDPDQKSDRDDIRNLYVVTIDPADARDFDDAISLQPCSEGMIELGVHIADVSAFVSPGSALDKEARERGTSVYFPKKVVPMLPETLSNGVCSLKPGEPRFAKSVFITYDSQGQIRSSRVSESIIQSNQRLTYSEAQHIIDGESTQFSAETIEIVREMEKLARIIEKRRIRNGQIHLDLPEVRLIFDDEGRVVDAKPESMSYSHKIIEMFMVEANDVVATLFHQLEQPIIRRIHPEPDEESFGQLLTFLRACGHKIAARPKRQDIQALINAVKDRPEGYAANLAVLRTFQQAQYSLDLELHYALASPHYCHFTSPIRRYPDLTVHRALSDHLRGGCKTLGSEEIEKLAGLADHCSGCERQAAAAEQELRQVLILQHLAGKSGDSFNGIVTGIADFGIFVQFPRFLIDGLVRLADLGDDWWDVQAIYGRIRGERTGKIYRIGDRLTVQIKGVDIARRQLDISVQSEST